MSTVNGKADDGSQLHVPVVSYYHEQALRRMAEGQMHDAQRRAEVAERKLAELEAAILAQAPDSALGRRVALQEQLRQAGLGVVTGVAKSPS